MQDWLTFIIVILILGVVLDGIRRMRAHRRETLRMSRTMPADEDVADDQEDLSSSEFPGGGPRVVGVRDTSDLADVNQTLRQSYAASKLTRGAPKRQVNQLSPKSASPVPMLMEPVEANNAEPADVNQEPPGQQEREPVIGSLDNLDDDYEDRRPAAETQQPAATDDEDFFQSTPYRPVGKEPVQEEAQGVTHDNIKEAEPQRTAAAEQQPPEAEARPQPREDHKPAAKQEAIASSNEAPRAAPDEVLVIHIMARRGHMFAGPELLDAMLAQGLRFGDMDIFHRYETSDGRGKILFSVANMVVPGTFDLEEMDDFQSPGISMFLSLPIEGDSLAAYNLMAESAQNIAQLLGGELKDENRSVMTRQTIEHGRQRVLEYERKRRLAKA